MPEVQGGERSLLVQRWGPAPVWLWGLGLLAVAWLYAKWRDGHNAKSQAQTDAASNAGGDYAAEGQNVSPQFVIMNNIPPTIYPTPGPGGAPSTPVGSNPATPVVSPPGKSAQPPVVAKPPLPVSEHNPTKPPIPYRWQAGDTLAKLAARYKVPGGAEALWNFNVTPGVRDAATIAVLRKRTPGGLIPGETILIPQS